MGHYAKATEGPACDGEKARLNELMMSPTSEMLRGELETGHGSPDLQHPAVVTLLQEPMPCAGSIVPSPQHPAVVTLLP
ncbi:hypothetical protein E5288_WYG012422 [Bos mutus]|uniref:Uncharacterized protein n=1 Tax=Bos mutus TaxID=72004 RepID=A0A6B0RY23_9CETA|nr:hypothetical protein [Bos mutus]